MRMSDWSSDVCSSDLCAFRRFGPVGLVDPQFMRRRVPGGAGRERAGAVFPGAFAKAGGGQMMRFWFSAICFAVALAATPAIAQAEGRGTGYVAPSSEELRAGNAGVGTCHYRGV